MAAQPITQVRQQLRAPRAAAVAGIVFAVLLLVSLILLRLSVPATPRDAGTWLTQGTKSVALALNLLPFSGIAFLWFIAVVRDHLGELEDRFFATIFLGSGLLFVAMLFTTAAIAGGLIVAFEQKPALLASDTYTFGRVVMYQIANVFAVKMAGVFMISCSTLWLRTGILPRWTAFVGYGVAAILLLTLTYIDWISVLFPLWVLLISVYFLIEHSGQPSSAMAAPEL
jgi:hypothetical protein